MEGAAIGSYEIHPAAVLASVGRRGKLMSLHDNVDIGRLVPATAIDGIARIADERRRGQVGLGPREVPIIGALLGSAGQAGIRSMVEPVERAAGGRTINSEVVGGAAIDDEAETGERGLPDLPRTAKGIIERLGGIVVGHGRVRDARVVVDVGTGIDRASGNKLYAVKADIQRRIAVPVAEHDGARHAGHLPSLHRGDNPGLAGRADDEIVARHPVVAEAPSDVGAIRAGNVVEVFVRQTAVGDSSRHSDGDDDERGNASAQNGQFPSQVSTLVCDGLLIWDFPNTSL